MRIKEIEMLSGIKRENIQLYEREGLISSKRLDNGYLDYTKEDLQILLRIKLLLSLNISLDEIKALKDGSKDLSEMLSKQIEKLEQEKQDTSNTQDICCAMQEDRVTFINLDAKKYLDNINCDTKEKGNSYFTVKWDTLPQVFYPWRRYFARTLDLFFYNTLWSCFLGLVFHVNLTARGNINNLLDTFVATAIMLFLEPLLLHLFGTTLGKVIFGLQIGASDNRRLSYAEGLKRTWGVIGAGMGFNIPIYNLVRLCKSYNLCSENEIQPWDEDISYTIKDTRWYRGVIYVGAYIALIAILIMSLFIQQLPPNRGNLTVAEFAENYNYYAKYFDINFGDEYLNENGSWAKNTFDKSNHVKIGYAQKPKYIYAIENGYVKGVSFKVEMENSQKWLNSYDNQMLLLSFAFVGAQDEIGLFPKELQRIAEQIENNTFENFDFTEVGVVFTCDTEHSGYMDIKTDFLLPKENVKETYFSLEFSMHKLK